MIDRFPLHGWMEDMPWRCTKVTTVEVPEYFRGSDERRLDMTVSRIHSLKAFKKEEARPWTVISLYKGDLHTVRIRNDGRDIHWQRVYPFAVN